MLRIAAVSGARRAELAALQWTDLHGRDADDRLGDRGRQPRRRQARAPRRRDQDGQHPQRHARPRHRRRHRGAARASASRTARGCSASAPSSSAPTASAGGGSEPARIAGIDAAWRLHDLRHWSATVAIGQGHDVRTVAGRLGHANPAMTLRVYAHAFAAADQAVAAGLGDLLKEPRRRPTA